MKKLTYLLMACLCMTLWSCGEESNETPSMDVTTSFEGRLSGSEESFLGTEKEKLKVTIRRRNSRTMTD